MCALNVTNFDRHPPTQHKHLSTTSPTCINAPPTTETYTLSLHDALPICRKRAPGSGRSSSARMTAARRGPCRARRAARSEEHTSELQSPYDLVCRLLLEKKKKRIVFGSMDEYFKSFSSQSTLIDVA